MPKPTKGPRLGGSPTHERTILRNMAAQLFQHGRITTTETKARRVQPLAEKLITKAKRGDLHSRRLVLQAITDRDVVDTLFTEIAPSLTDREGGYTRITKVGPRKGDNAPMAIIEIITESVEDSRTTRAKSGRATTKAAPAATTQDDAVEPESTESENIEEAASPEAAAAEEIAAEVVAEEIVEEAIAEEIVEEAIAEEIAEEIVAEEIAAEVVAEEIAEGRA